MQAATAIFFGILVTVIGAIPLGLVNLSVLDISHHKGYKEGMRIAHGASLMEVLFGLAAVLTGMFFQEYIKENIFLNYTIIAVILLIGFVFLFKRNRSQNKSRIRLHGFLKGMFLNLVSIQVFMFWIVATTVLYNNHLYIHTPGIVILFLAGIWLGKISVLWIYARMSRIIITKSNFLAKHINRIIGCILLITGLIQFLKL